MEAKKTLIEVLEIIMTFLGVISVPIFTFLGIREKARIDAKKNLKAHKDELVIHHTASEMIAISFSDLKILDELNQSITNIFKETRADRFLVLMAANGHHRYKYVSVLYQRQGSDLDVLDAVNRYQNLRIDDRYREMLLEAERNHSYYFNTENEPPSLLKSIYLREGVKDSLVYFIVRLPLDNETDIMLYISVASKQENVFGIMDKTIIDMAVQSSIAPCLKKVTGLKKMT